MVPRLADEVRMVVNASSRDKDLALLREYAPPAPLSLTARSSRCRAEAETVFSALKPEARKFAFMQVGVFDDWLVSRSGYGRGRL